MYVVVLSMMRDELLETLSTTNNHSHKTIDIQSTAERRTHVWTASHQQQQQQYGAATEARNRRRR